MKTSSETFTKLARRYPGRPDTGARRALFPAIVTCTGNHFTAECLRLRRKIDEHLAPDLVLGIQTGGGVILDTMLEHGGIWHPHGYVSASRGSSKLKKGRISLLLRLLPRSFSNGLRIVEHICREASFSGSPVVAERQVSLRQDVAERIAKARRICLIDDAIDTGSTVVNIRNAIRAVNPSAEVFCAALTQTFERPLIRPDVVLFHRTLLRFPWAIDAHDEI